MAHEPIVCTPASLVDAEKMTNCGKFPNGNISASLGLFSPKHSIRAFTNKAPWKALLTNL
tara:strand:- start:577 stop:756 length:180 start_codon:yes stop_codon:yes gene_type:complete